MHLRSRIELSPAYFSFVNVPRAFALGRNLARARVSPHRWRHAVLVARAAGHHGAIQKLTEFAPLAALVARQRPTRVLEIGSARGGTLWAWCQVAADDAVLVSVDLPGGPFDGRDDDVSAWLKYARPEQRIELIRGDSHAVGTFERARSALEGAVDFLFIDGDHTYEGVRSDFEMYGALVHPGGMIAFHDIMPEPDLPPEAVGDVHLFWPEVKARFRYREILDPIDDRGWGGRWGGIGIVYP